MLEPRNEKSCCASVLFEITSGSLTFFVSNVGEDWITTAVAEA
jgi:hypothetical protein